MIDYAFTITRVMVCAAAAFFALGLMSNIRTMGAGNVLQVKWAEKNAGKTALAGGGCLGMGAL